MDLDSKEGIRSIWRRGWLWSLDAFTSLKNQEELWLAKRPGEMQTFEECMCCYFDDTFHGESLEDKCRQGFLDNSEVEACRNFHILASAYEPSKVWGDDRMILADPKWHAVVASAQEAWEQLRAIIKLQEEVAIMTDCDKERKI